MAIKTIKRQIACLKGFLHKLILILLHFFGAFIRRKLSAARKKSAASMLHDTSPSPISNSCGPPTEAEQTSLLSSEIHQEKQESTTVGEREAFDQARQGEEGSSRVFSEDKTRAELKLEQDHVIGTKKLVDKAEKREQKILHPEKRGGRSRSQSTAVSTGDECTKILPWSVGSRSRPEVVCWKDVREWVVGIEIPDDISKSSGLRVFQDRQSLSESANRPGCWILYTLEAPVKVIWADKSIEIPLEGNKGLLFKLSGRRLEQGRKVKQVSSGLYLTLVPDRWRRDEEKASNAPASPELVFLEGYQAHFFNLTGSQPSCVAFLDEHNQTIILGDRGPQFHLVGNEINDESEWFGPLFGGSLPQVTIYNGSWADVSLIVVGQEGSGHGRWRLSLKPISERAEQDLPQEILQRKSGWYFVRLYDSADTLIDSLAFRFVAGLKAITILTKSIVPPPDGHVMSTVEILHEAGYSLTHLGEKCADLQVEPETQKTILKIPPRAECDLTRWSIRTQDDTEREVELAILVKRLWWSLGPVDAQPSHWEDKPVQVSPEDFTAASNKAVWLRLPKPRLVAAVFAGFWQESSRKFPVRVTDSTVAIPLRDFSATQELEHRGDECEFKVWVEIEGFTHQATIAVLPALHDIRVLDLTEIPAHRFATLLTRIRRVANSPTRRLIKEIRRKYCRQRRSQLARNEDFVKESLCLIALLMEDSQYERQLRSLLPERWKTRADLARKEFPDLVRQHRIRLIGKNNGGSL